MDLSKKFKQDISACKKLASAFHKKYGKVFGLNEGEMVSNVEAKEYLGYGAETFIGMSVKSNISDKLKVGETKPSIAVLWISTGINPNGVSASQGIARTYTIHLEIKGKKRDTLRRYSNNSIYFKIYDYGVTIDEVLDKVQSKMYSLEKLTKEDGLVFSEINYGSKFDNGGGVGVSSEINSDDNEIGTGADLNTDQYGKGGKTGMGFIYTIGGL